MYMNIYLFISLLHLLFVNISFRVLITLCEKCVNVVSGIEEHNLNWENSRENVLNKFIRTQLCCHVNTNKSLFQDIFLMNMCVCLCVVVSLCFPNKFTNTHKTENKYNEFIKREKIYLNESYLSHFMFAVGNSLWQKKNEWGTEETSKEQERECERQFSSSWVHLLINLRALIFRQRKMTSQEEKLGVCVM